MNIEIKIIEKQDALALFNDPEFIARWNFLYNECSHRTIMQSYNFVKTWAQVYKETFDLLFVLGINQQSEIIGVIPLAFTGNTLVHAGDKQAEYHGWIGLKEYDLQFITAAISELNKKYNLTKWIWGWTAPNAPFDFIGLTALQKQGIYVHSIQQKSPVLALNDQEKINQLNKSRSLKTKINRYKKRGDLRLKKIKTAEEANQVLQTFQNQFDFRKIGMRQEPLFTIDVLKYQYIFEKIKDLENVHFTVLLLDNKPLAFHLGECDDTTVYLTLISHDPTEGKNSPGKIIMLYLIDLLREEGYQYFDLTPGGDTYKDYYANTYIDLEYVTFYFNWFEKFIRDLRISLKSITKKTLQLLSLNPTKLSEKKNQLSTLNVTKPQCAYYLLTSTSGVEEKRNDATLFSINAYEDLLMNVTHSNWEDFQDQFSYALRNFNAGNKLLTYTQNGSLVMACWLISNKTELFTSSLFVSEYPIEKEDIVLNIFWLNSLDSHNQGFDLMDEILSYLDCHGKVYLKTEDGQTDVITLTSLNLKSLGTY